ncbi:hypothetical protein CASFOL_032007 [Castilleja foliolosa]|uniref:BHLH domain-containing protein n=1 Tax=Castilleja foliolosa TaxID=1961234 RepID=A0ABD3C1E2_9LAMI
MDNSSYSNPNSSMSTSQASKEKGKKKGGDGCGGGMKLSTDPQSVAARQRRHRISDRFKILRSLVPGGSKLDTVSMLEEAIHYVKFLKAQIWLHQAMIGLADDVNGANEPTLTFPANQCPAVSTHHHHDPYLDLSNNHNNDYSDDQVGEAELGFGLGFW